MCLKSASLLALVSLFSLVMVGCGGSKDPQALATQYSNEFKSAPPGVKAAWDTAVAADKTNGFALALSTLQMLQTQPGLTEKQTKAIGETATAISDRMYAAVNKGDANAQKELDELRSLRRR